MFSTNSAMPEKVALRASTGVRVWYRNVDFRGDAQLSSTDVGVVFNRQRAQNRVLVKDPAHMSKELREKVLFGLLAGVMMVLALPFAYLQDRMGAVSIKVFAGIMLGVLFNMLNGLFSSLGIINQWPPFVAAITPSVIFTLTASAMLWWSERR